MKYIAKTLKATAFAALLLSATNAANADVTFNPASGSDVTELDGIMVNFGTSDWQINNPNQISFLYFTELDEEEIAIGTTKYSLSGIDYCYVYFSDEQTRRAAGNYQLSIGAGAVTIDGTPNEAEIIGLWTIGGGVPTPTDYTFSFTPNPATPVSYLQTITIRCSGGSISLADASHISLNGPDGNVAIYASESDFNSTGELIISVGDTPIFTPGNYQLLLGAGSMKIKDELYSTPVTTTFTVQKVGNWTGNIIAAPADGSEVASLKNFSLDFEGAASVVVYEYAPPSAFPRLFNTDYNREVQLATVMASGHMLNIMLYGEVTDPGHYELRVPRSLFVVDGSEMTSDCILHYTIPGEIAAIDYKYTFSPQPGSLLDANGHVSISFSGNGVTRVENDQWAWGTNAPAFISPEGERLGCRIVPHDDGLTYDFIPYYPFETNGKYILLIPAAYFTFFNNDGESVKNRPIDAFYYVGQKPQESTLPEMPDETDTVLLWEDFNGDYTKSFPYIYDKDHDTPHSDIASLFYSASAQTYMPWWVVRDNAQDTDKYIGSHSYYTEPGASSDWLISIPITIDSEGYVLDFDAQSVTVRGAEYVSDLSLFITEELIDPKNLPATPTYVWEELPTGDNPDNCANDWSRYRFSLDDYTGKTIYINFANLNFDKDILCIDNVIVWRHNNIALSVDEFDNYTTDSEANITLRIKALENIANWDLTATSAETTLDTWSGSAIEKGTEQVFSFTLPLTIGLATPFEVTLTSEGNPAQKFNGQITGMAFSPIRRVFFEESTSLACGNCPAGAYNVECMLDDPDLADKVVPVAVHIMAMGNDPMAVSDYYNNLPISTQAPLVFVNRSAEYDGFTTVDCTYNPQNQTSFAYRIAQKTKEPTYINLDVTGEWIINGNDTTAIACTVTVTPAYNIADKNLRVAFILTENNVGLDRHGSWIQSNYFGGYPELGPMGGWTALPQKVHSARFHDVARAISAYNGHPNSLPLAMTAGNDYTFTYTLSIPDTYKESSGRLMSAAIQRQFCELSAIVIDSETGLVVNAARIPMSNVANNRYSTWDVLYAGIENVDIDADNAPTVFYNLHGQRVDNPQNGIFIRVQGNKVSKVTL